MRVPTWGWRGRCATCCGDGAIGCWLASDDIVGDDWPAQIASAVAASDALIVLLSEAANRSAHVAREVTLAVQKERPVIPIRLEEVEPEGSLTYLLALAQWVDVYPGPVDAHAEGVVAHIEALLDAPKPAARGGTGRPSRVALRHPLR